MWVLIKKTDVGGITINKDNPQSHFESVLLGILCTTSITDLEHLATDQKMRVRFLRGVPFCKIWTYSLMVKRASKINARFLVSTPSVFVIHHAPSINNGGYGSISCFSPHGCVRLMR